MNKIKKLFTSAKALEDNLEPLLEPPEVEVALIVFSFKEKLVLLFADFLAKSCLIFLNIKYVLNLLDIQTVKIYFILLVYH